MEGESFLFNGIDGAAGSYLTGALSAKAVSALALGTPLDEVHVKELQTRHRRDTEETFGPTEGVDPKDLASAGWGVIFPHDLPPGIQEALGELLTHRQAKAAKSRDNHFKAYAGPDAYRPGETKRAFLARHGAAAGMAADPEKVPYYLLLVGSPEALPFSFQYQLDVEYAVGRLWFEKADGKPDLDAFARYARSVVEAENGQLRLPRRATFIGVRNKDDGATNLSASHLVRPLADRLTKARSTWEFQTAMEERAGKSDLAALLNGPDVPALLFTASHGMGFPNGDPRQFPHQGALLCQDWPGPISWGQKPIPSEYYLAAEDVGDDARLLGLVAFHFACYGAGTPRLDDFAHLKQLTRQAPIAPRPFVARLPQRLLGHPKGGALAVIGHVERAWSCSFHGGAKLGEQLQAFESALLRLLDGFPVGYAMEYFNQLYAALSSEVSKELEDAKYGKSPDDWELASMWTANNDARSYLLLGDPAVRLAAVAEDSTQKDRPVLKPVTVFTSPASPNSTTPSLGNASTKEASADGRSQASTDKTNSATSAPATVTMIVQDGGMITLQWPVQITVHLGNYAIVRPADSSPSPEVSTSFAAATAEPISIDPVYENREGYDPEFLGAGKLSVALPRLSPDQEADAAPVLDAEPGTRPYELKYHHFSVVVNRKRRLAYFAAGNIDGRFSRKIERANDKWAFDPRIGRDEQVGNTLYGRPFDRGHLVRRLDPAWGRTRRVAKVANDDTFHWTNCSPQHFRFNEGKNLWAGVEDYLLDKAADERKRLTVFTGPVFEENDPEYRGVRIPKRFWKVAIVVRPNGRLAALGFIVSQETLLRDFISFDPADVARTFQVPVRQVQEMTGLDFGPLATLDAGGVEHFAPGAEIRSLDSFEEIRLPE